jgi:glycosyltransferase involved in cell wall biosynthesis
MQRVAAMSYSLVVPIYKNEDSLPDLLDAVAGIDRALHGRLEAVFVVDGSPDRSYEKLAAELPRAPFRSRLVLLSRNFGSFSAIRAGLAAARGQYFAVMAADLQEPPQLVLDFFNALEHEPVDVALGVRASRRDPFWSRVAAQSFWWIYRRLVQREVPPGGVDMFACTRVFRDRLLELDELNTSLVGQIIWLGFRRKFVTYERLPRRHGKSAWTFGRKLSYLMDSLFAFTDWPIRALIAVGVLGLAISTFFGIVVLVARLMGEIPIPGYAATVLIITFFAALNSFGLGVVGSYTWRAYENTKHRPQAVVLASADFPGQPQQERETA